MAVVLGFLIAVVLHAAFLLFGGLLIPQAKPDQGTLQKVELFSQDEVEQAQKEEQKDEPRPSRTTRSRSRKRRRPTPRRSSAASR